MIDYKSLFQIQNVVSLSQIIDGEELPLGCNDIICEHFIIKSFLISNKPLKSNKKLYIFLSAIGVKSKPYPLFNRVSWTEFYDGLCLYFDDPMRNIHNDFAPFFFFGEENHDLMLSLELIIRSLMKTFNILPNDVTFISSSNGGFAAISLCNKFDGTRCISFNPQLDIKCFFNEEKFEKFKQLVKIDPKNINTKQLQERLNLYSIIENKKSKFFIYSNFASESDKIQIESFFKKIGREYHNGLNIVNNIYFYITNIKSIDDPHLVQPNMYFTKYLADIFFFLNDKFGNKILDLFNKQLTDNFSLEEKNWIIKTYFSTITSDIKIQHKRGHVFDIILNRFFVIRMSFNKNIRNTNQLVFKNLRIYKSLAGFNLNKISQFCLENDLLLDQSTDMVNIYSNKPIPLSEFCLWLKEISKNLDFDL